MSDEYKDEPFLCWDLNISELQKHKPLSGNRRCSIQSKLPHHTLLQILLLPFGHVSLQSQDPLLLLPQLLHHSRGVELRRDHTATLGVSLALDGGDTQMKVNKHRTQTLKGLLLRYLLHAQRLQLSLQSCSKSMLQLLSLLTGRLKLSQSLLHPLHLFHVHLLFLQLHTNKHLFYASSFALFWRGVSLFDRFRALPPPLA